MSWTAWVCMYVLSIFPVPPARKNKSMPSLLIWCQAWLYLQDLKTFAYLLHILGSHFVPGSADSHVALMTIVNYLTDSKLPRAAIYHS